MSPIDPDLSARFAKSYTEAAFGYARAATAAYANLAEQTIGMWAKALERPEPSRPSAFVVGRPRRAAEPQMLAMTTPFEVMQMANPWLRPGTPAYMSVKAWWGLFPLEGNPIAWPMAYAMMTAGIPREVALPTAQANAAMGEVVELAQRSMASAFSSYQSDGGHASSHYYSPQTDAANVMWPAPWTWPKSRN